MASSPHCGDTELSAFLYAHEPVASVALAWWRVAEARRAKAEADQRESEEMVREELRRDVY